MVLASREFIAVPDDKKNQIVFKWPDVRIRKFTRAIVDADQMALFINTGQVIGTMGPGRHQIDAQELPFLGSIIDFATGGNAYRAELFFVGTREYPGLAFGGRIDDVQDPQTGMIVTLRVFGDYSLQGQRSRRPHHQPDRDGRRDQQPADGGLGQRPAPQGHADRGHDPDRPQRLAHPGTVGLHARHREGGHRGRQQPARHLRLAIVRMGNFDVNLSDGGRGAAEEPGQGHRLSRLAGGFNQYARGEMALGAGQGMAKGGGSDSGVFLAAGLGLGGQLGGGRAGRRWPAGTGPSSGTGVCRRGRRVRRRRPRSCSRPCAGRHRRLPELPGRPTGGGQVLLSVRRQPASSGRSLRLLRYRQCGGGAVLCRVWPTARAPTRSLPFLWR